MLPDSPKHFFGNIEYESVPDFYLPFFCHVSSQFENIVCIRGKVKDNKSEQYTFLRSRAGYIYSFEIFKRRLREGVCGAFAPHKEGILKV